MKKKYNITTLAYLMLSLGYAIHGLLLLFTPNTAYILLFLSLPEGHFPTVLVQWLGLAELMLAMLLFWCGYHAKRSKTVHRMLTFFIVGAAVLQSLSLYKAAVLPSSVLFWLSFVGLALVPAVLMGVMALPARPHRHKGAREQGSVKWFNETKGFGFITRDQGDDVFAHYRSIRGEGRRTLREGQRVAFVVIKEEKGLQAEDIQLL